MKMAGSNILTRKQLEKMTINQLIQFAMKLQNNMINKQTELINDNKEFREKLSIIDSKGFGPVKDLSKECLIESFWISNGTIKIRESSQSKPVSITHEFDLQF